MKKDQLKLQIPVSKKLKADLKRKTEDLGFSSMSDAIRLILQSFTYGDFTFQLVENKQKPYELLDLETERRLDRSMKDLKNKNTMIVNTQDPDFFEKMLEYGED